jgi:hypothetical protein
MPVQTRSAARRETYETLTQRFRDAQKTRSSQQNVCLTLLQLGTRKTDSAYIDALKAHTDTVANIKSLRAAIRAHPAYNKHRSAAATALRDEMEDMSMGIFEMSSDEYLNKIKEQMRRLFSPEGFELLSGPNGAVVRRNTVRRCAIYTKKRPDCMEFAVFSSGVKGMCFAIEQMEKRTTA